MEKKSFGGIKIPDNLKSFLAIMRITLFLLFFSILFSNAATSFSQESKFTLDFKSATVQEILREIERESNYRFLFDGSAKEIIHKTVNLSVSSQNIEEVLNTVLANTEFSHRILDNQVVIYKDEAKVTKSKTTQQDRKRITGQVLDISGQSIIGANIIEKGTSNGTITDIDGNFSLTVASDAIIHISYIGYISQDIPLSGRESLSITLREDTKALDEIVVIGYGETTRGDLTGSVSSIKGNTLVSTGTSSFTEALQGRLAGVHVNMQSGEPGASVDIQIRGANSISASSSPLYVIDGMQMDVNEGEVASSDVGGYTTYNPLASINPNDIESIDVLKDASATAIYGARGANGVIIITTKTAQRGNPRVNLDISYGLSEAPKRLDMLEPQDYLDYRFLFGGGANPWGHDLNGDGTIDVPYQAVNYQTHNWQDELLRTGVTQRYNVSVQQGLDKVNYLFGVGYDKQEGVIESNDFTRFSANMKINAKLSEKLEMGISGNYGQTSTDGAVSSGGGAGSYSGLIQTMYTEKPVAIYVPDENAGVGTYVPITTMFFDSFKNVGFNSVNGNIFAQYKIIPDLSLRVSVSGRNTFSKMQEFYGKETLWGRSNGGRAGIQDVRTVSFTQSNTLTYTKRINDNYLTAMIGQEISSYKSSNHSIRVYNFEDESTGVYDLAKGQIVDKPTSYTYKTSRLSYFGRLNYNIGSRYYFTATFRGDGSSNFGSGNRFGYFPSGAFAWRISNEEFLKDVREISNLRLRLSYGLTGNDRMSSYAALARLGIQNYAGNGNPLYGMAPNQSPNPNLKWEATAQTNIGLDFGLLDERFSLTADVYKKVTNDLLLNTPIPSQTGYTQQMQNIGSIENKGFELTINSMNIAKKDFDWSTTFNFDLNRNKVTSLGDAEFLPVTIGSGHLTDVGRVIVGQPIGTAFGYIADGIYQLDDFNIFTSNGSPANVAGITERNYHLYTYELKEGITSVAGVNLKPGDRKYLDLNGDGVINSDDRTIISDSNPDFNIGLNNSFRYKQFTLSFFFEGVFGKDILNAFTHRAEAGISGSAPTYNLTQDYFFNRWTPTNPSYTYAALKNGTNGFTSSYYIEDATFVRFKNLTVGYTFDRSLIEKLQINQLRVNFTVDNLFVWTKYSGLDPDIRSATRLLPGFDRLSYPRARTFLVGLNLEF